MNELLGEIELQLSNLNEFNKENSLSFPLDSLTDKVPAIASIVSNIKPFIGEKNRGGLMWVDTKGGELFKKHGSNKFIGNIASENGSVGGGLAELTPIANLSPQVLLITAATASITHRLDEIKEVQTEMYDFLKAKDDAELKGDLNFLIDSFNKIMINFDDKNYIDSIKNQLNDITRTACTNVEKYKLFIIKEIDKKQWIHFQGDVNKRIDEIKKQLSKYQLSVYMHALSQYLLVRVNNSTKREYLDEVASSIESISLTYRDVYSKVYESLEQYSKNSGEQLLLSGVSSIEKLTGKLINKVPLIKDRTIGNKIIEQSEKTNEYKKSMHTNTLSQLLDKQKAQVAPYIDNIRLMSHVYNDNIQIGFDNNNLYISNVCN